jgi:hypothetical protein
MYHTRNRTIEGTYAIATTLTILRNLNSSGCRRLWRGGRCGLWVYDGGGWPGSSGKREIGSDGVAVGNHGRRRGSILRRVASRQCVEVCKSSYQRNGSTESAIPPTSAFNSFVDAGCLPALVNLSVRHESEGTAALGNATNISALIHSPLKRISIPAKDVVSVLPVASPRKVE